MGNDNPPHLSPNLHIILRIKILKQISRSGTRLSNTLQMYISANFGPRVRSVTFGKDSKAAVEEVDLGDDSHFSHVRVEAKGTGRAQG